MTTSGRRRILFANAGSDTPLEPKEREPMKIHCTVRTLLLIAAWAAGTGLIVGLTLAQLVAGLA